TTLSNGTKEEYEHLETIDHVLNKNYATVLLDLLKGTDRQTGYRITPMQHALQTATRAIRDGADDEIVFAALFHDVADVIAPTNHAQVAAAMLKPFISERTHWVIEHHAIFQGYYFWHHIGKDRNARDRFNDHPHFQACAEFCERWDQISFDPAYD